MPNILDILNPIKAIGDIASGIIGKFIADPKEKAAAQLALFEAQAGLQAKLLDLQSTLAVEQSKIVVAEAQSQSWIARNWRPMTMLVFTYIVAHNYIIAPLFHVASVPMPNQLWSLLQIGIGGYIGGRTLEKVVPGIVDVIRNGKNDASE